MPAFRAARSAGPLICGAVLAVLATPPLVAAESDGGSWFIGAGIARYSVDFDIETEAERRSSTDRETGGELRLGWRGERHRFYGSATSFRGDDYRLRVASVNADVLYPLNDVFYLMAGGSLVAASQGWDQSERDRASSAGLGFQVGIVMPVAERLELEAGYRQLFTRMRTTVDGDDGEERLTAERIGSTHLFLNYVF